MTQYKDIPLATDQRNVSQNDIRQNFGYLMPAPSISATGILPVDHKATGNNSLNPSDGFHAQVSLVDRTSPASLVNAVNSQSSSGIFYSKTDSGESQLHYTNAIHDWQITPCFPVRMAVNFDGTFAGTITPPNANIRNSFNVSSIQRFSVGSYQINFTTAIGSNLYFPLALGMRDSANDICNVQVTGAAAYNTSIGTNFIRIQTNGQSDTLRDMRMITVVIFGG